MEMMKIYVIYIMGTELVKITPSEKTKLYLNIDNIGDRKKVKTNNEEEIDNSNYR